MSMPQVIYVRKWFKKTNCTVRRTSNISLHRVGCIIINEMLSNS